MRAHKAAVVVVAYCWMVGGVAGSAGAQTMAGSLDELRGTLKPGTRISVVDATGQTMTGKLTDLSATSLHLLVNGKDETLPEGSVREIRERHRSTGRGAAMGALVGAGLGLAVGLSAADSCSDCNYGSATPGGFVMAGIVGFSGLGAGIGAAIGAGITRERLVYRARPEPAVAVSLIPAASPHGASLRASIRF